MDCTPRQDAPTDTAVPSEPGPFSDPFLAVHRANRAIDKTAEAAALLIQRLHRAKMARRQAFFARTGVDEARKELFDNVDQPSLKERPSRETTRVRNIVPKPISAVRRLSVRAMASLRSQHVPSLATPHQAAEGQTAVTVQDKFVRVNKMNPRLAMLASDDTRFS
jgi:hypothetical protein